MLELADRQKRTRKEVYSNGSEFGATKSDARCNSRIRLDQNVPAISKVSHPLQLTLPEPAIISQNHVDIKLDTNDRDFQYTLSSPLPVNKALSWDDVINYDEHVPGSELVTSSEPEFTEKLQSTVLWNAANIFLGLDTDLVHWRQCDMQFEVSREIQNSRIGSFLSQCTVTGSYLRRLSRAVHDLRATPNDGSTSPSIFSLAAAIQQEISMFQIKGKQLYSAQTIIEFAKLSLPLSTDIRLLAMLIGCQNLQSQGVVSRIPSAIELLNRAYSKAHTTGSSMFWRIVVACLRPWFYQLNFAIGLKNPRIERSLNVELGQIYFPDLFIGFHKEKSDGVYLIEELIPVFVPRNIANAVLECYVLLSYMNGHDISVQNDIVPIKLPEEESAISFNHLRTVESYDLPELALPSSSSLSSPSSSPLPTSQCNTRSDIPNILSLMSPILIRARKLDLFVKQVYRADIEVYLKNILDLYLLHNGQTWSLFCDLLDKYTGRDLANAVNATIFTQYDKVRFCIEHGNSFKILYEPTEVMESMFGQRLLDDCQAIFSRIIQLQMTGNVPELAAFALRIEDTVKSIDKVFKDANRGIRDLIAQVKQISRLLTP